VTLAEPTVFVVDDDASVRDSLQLLMRSVDLRAETFASAAEFLEAYDPARSGCLVLDVRMPGMSGLVLQDRLEAIGATLPIIFLTAHGDVPMAVQAVRHGAIDFIQKPFRDQDLLDRIQRAIEQDIDRRQERAYKEEVDHRIASLTARERQVMEMVAVGKANKVIAADLGLSQRTVEIHRAHAMQKMQAESVPHLVRMLPATQSVES
jgi:FixJ family two-component response regulator